MTQGAALDESSVTRFTARRALDRHLASRTTRRRSTGGGRGIVLGAWGFEFFVCAWVCLRMLRRLGCDLPIELWHRDDHDWNDALTECVKPYDVRVVNASLILTEHPMDVTHRFALKPYAIVHSRFRQVLWLDADQVPVVNPEYLFESAEFNRTGAVFWPDFGRFKPDHPMWRLTGVSYRDEPEVQAGEILVDKEKCHDALQLTLWFNHHHRFFYKHIIGDKDTYRFAWHKLGQTYAMPPFPIHPLEGTMCQHDFFGHRILQHRNMRKWRLDRPNPRIAGFFFEDECLTFLDELRARLILDQNAEFKQPRPSV
jgi:hypothetical protein